MSPCPRLFLVLLAGLLLAAPALGAPSPAPTAPAPAASILPALPDLRQGDPCVLVLAEAPPPGSSLRLEIGGKPRTLRLSPLPGGGAAACFAVPLDAPAGPATLRLERPGQPAELRAFTVLKRDIISEEIPLTPTMSDIRATPDPRKEEQAKRYAAVLAGADPQAVHLLAPPAPSPAATATPAASTLPAAPPAPAVPRVLTAGLFQRPQASERRTAFYGDTRVYRYPDGKKELSRHWGVDYGIPTGSPVAAPAAGRVAMAENRISTGWTVIIEHLPGMFSIYMHLDRLAVAPGALVSTGTPIGSSGATGFATGPHLHWELRIDGVAADPEALLPADPRLVSAGCPAAR